MNASRNRPVWSLRQQIGPAFHEYHDAEKSFPPAAIHDEQGRPLLSWRVAIVPYLGEDALYVDWKVDWTAALRGVRRGDGRSFTTLWCDGSVRLMSNDIDPATWKKFPTPTAGELVE